MQIRLGGLLWGPDSRGTGQQSVFLGFVTVSPTVFDTHKQKRYEGDIVHSTSHVMRSSHHECCDSLCSGRFALI
jgi:hypothetical protein